MSPSSVVMCTGFQRSGGTSVGWFDAHVWGQLVLVAVDGVELVVSFEGFQPCAFGGFVPAVAGHEFQAQAGGGGGQDGQSANLKTGPSCSAFTERTVLAAGCPSVRCGLAGVTSRDMRLAYNKLVRDRIPEIIQSQGQQPITHVLDNGQYRAALLAKLLEEAQEAQSAPPEDLLSELADVLEVLQALVSAQGMSWDELLSLAARKRSQRGAFADRIFLEYVEQAG